MMSGIILFLCTLLSTGVFGDDVGTVSVLKGDSVMLHAAANIEIREIEWRFKEGLIASFDAQTNETSVDIEGAFGGRLQLDNQTGDLKITNIVISDSGLYKVQINRKERSKTFTVSVVSDDKMPSVHLGDSVTLPTVVSDTEIYDVIRWRFGNQKSPIAEVNRTTGNVSYDGAGERFRGRLQMDYWTGSLTITNTKTTDKGEYKVDLIRSSKYTIHKSFSVTVSGEIQPVSVTEGESINLNTGSVIESHDIIKWMFGDTFIVSIQNNIKIVNPDERFRDRLKLDHQTGDLNITNSRTTDSGVYKLKISSGKHIIHNKFNVTVNGSGLSAGAVTGICFAVIVPLVAAAAAVIYFRHKISKLNRQWKGIIRVPVGKSVTLNPKDTEIREDDDMQWKFGGSVMAERKGANGEITVHDERFKGQLQLDKVSGSLIITDNRLDMSGFYELQITRPEHESSETFSVYVFDPQDKGNKPEEGVPLVKALPDS